MVAEVMRITNGQGARVAFDPVGGPSFPKLVSALAFGGIIYIYGLLGTGVTPLPVLEMIAKVPTIKAHNIWLTSGNETRRKAAIEFVTKGHAETALLAVEVTRSMRPGSPSRSEMLTREENPVDST
jgi:NADPH:quinone reductase-like Zn-dependent oxidoreductase